MGDKIDDFIMNHGGKVVVVLLGATFVIIAYLLFATICKCGL